MSGTRARKPRIYDAVYGYVELDECEFRLVNTAVFQRLHWIKQLGPLHIVFPSAQHSRFSHTIGVFYIAQKMIRHLNGLGEYGYRFTRDETKILRFAALLHDIGHVPLSHVGERVLEQDAEARRKEQARHVKPRGDIDLVSQGVERSGKAWRQYFPDETLPCTWAKLHERLSAEIALCNKEIDGVLAGVWRNRSKREKCKRRIAQAIVGMDLSDVPTVLLHSELDADRLDYLLRDSFFTGVGYGQIDLDYIISRLVIYRKDSTDPGDLCVEHKGLHTVEHYILGRFFLQTQVIFNRKVRFLDLLFEDVMSYMLRDTTPENCRLMNLSQFCDCIRTVEGGDRRDHLHRIYSYTDADVFARMRALHEQLDRKEKEGDANDEELYINDCIKTIMDGDVAEPVFHTCHKLVSRLVTPDYEDNLRTRAAIIAKQVASKLGVYEKRIKVNLQSQEVMKYGRRFVPNQSAGQRRKHSSTGPRDDTNREAVRVMFRTPSGEDREIYAAESNAAILGDLTDKALLLFNCYYVRKKTGRESSAAIEAAVAKAFAGLRTKEFYG
jgi:HD superfamily phosphohydrolase